MFEGIDERFFRIEVRRKRWEYRRLSLDIDGENKLMNGVDELGVGCLWLLIIDSEVEFLKVLIWEEKR